jgi:hypothetical protein
MTVDLRDEGGDTRMRKMVAGICMAETSGEDGSAWRCGERVTRWAGRGRAKNVRYGA